MKSIERFKELGIEVDQNINIFCKNTRVTNGNPYILKNREEPVLLDKDGNFASSFVYMYLLRGDYSITPAHTSKDLFIIEVEKAMNENLSLVYVLRTDEEGTYTFRTIISANSLYQEFLETVLPEFNEDLELVEASHPERIVYYNSFKDFSEVAEDINRYLHV
jgi:hypothetical protein